MHQSFDELHQQARESADKYLANLNNGRPVQKSDPATWKMYDHLGWLGLNLNTSLGGEELPYTYSLVLLERMGYWLARDPYVFSTVIPTVVCNKLAHQETARTLLATSPRIVPAWQEIALDVRPGWMTSLTCRPSGGFQLSGRKLFVPAWDPDCHLLVSAQIDSEPCLVYVPATASGISAVPCKQTDDSLCADVVLDQVELPSTALVSRGDDAVATLDAAICFGTVGLAAQLCGLARGALDMTVSYVSQRQQFGRTIGSFQVIRHRIADIAMSIELACASTRRALQTLLSDEPTSPKALRAVSCAKIAASEAALLASRESIQMHGAIGYTQDADPGLFLNAALCWSAQLGGDQYHLNRLSSLSTAEEVCHD